MQKLRTLLTIYCLLPIGAIAQFQTHNPVRFTSFYVQSSIQTEQRFIDTSGKLRQSAASIACIIPLVNKEWNQKHYSSFAIQLQPSLNSTLLRTNISERLLRNPQLSVSSFYTFRTSNRIAVTIRAQMNEDEFTSTHPQLLWNGIAYYSRNFGEHLQLHAGGTYSFVWGQKRWYPVAGFDLSFGTRTRLTALFPLFISYQFVPTGRIKFSAFAKPTGLMSFYENRLSIADTTIKTLNLSIESMSAGFDISWFIVPSLTISLCPAFSPQQTLQLHNVDLSSSYSSHTLSNSFVFTSRLIWRPWQTNKRNNNRQPYRFNTDFDASIPF